VAVRNDLAAGLDAEPLGDLARVEVHQAGDIDVARARDVSLSRVARLPRSAVVLMCRPDVQHREGTEARRKLVERDLAHSARTTSTSAAIAGRCSSSPSQAATRSGSSTESMSRARITHGTYAMSE
jgi:hypothetical protein